MTQSRGFDDDDDGGECLLLACNMTYLLFLIFDVLKCASVEEWFR
jgi:hypothetical protein